MQPNPWTRPATAIAALVITTAACAVGTADSLSDDAGPPDTGANAPDSSVRHDAAGALDSGAVDAPAPDAGSRDAGAVDSSIVDASPRDTSTADTSAADDAAPDAGSPDTGAPDTGVVDAGAPDAEPDSGIVCAAQGFRGTLVTFDFGGQPGSEASVAASSTAVGVASGPVTRAAGVTAVGGSGSINASNWATSTSADPGRYYTFTVTPAAGCGIALTSLALDVHASGSGPSSGDVATSAAGFSAHSSAFSGTSNGAVTLSGAGSGAIEVRIYGFGASSSGGTFRIQSTMTLTGSIN